MVNNSRSYLKPDTTRVDIDIYQVRENAAAVKMTGTIWFDYFHMLKLNGKWQIVNIMFETLPSNQWEKPNQTHSYALHLGAMPAPSPAPACLSIFSEAYFKRNGRRHYYAERDLIDRYSGENLTTSTTNIR